MTEDHSSDLLGQLPRTRPHRRSAKRPPRPENGASATAKPAAKQQAAPKAAKRQAAPKRPARKPAEPKAKRLPQPAQPRGVPTASRRRSSQASRQRSEQASTPVLRTAAQAASELAEIGLTLSTRALRRAIGRLPRP